MSSVKKVKPKIQKIYTNAYTWIRLNRNGYYRHMPMDIQTLPQFGFHSFIFALISHDNACREFGGWINPYRERQFRNLKAGRLKDSRLPF